MVCPEGIEPPTHSLEGCCSIQLSYGQMSMNAVSLSAASCRSYRSTKGRIPQIDLATL
jgi:hypothetical protein